MVPALVVFVVAGVIARVWWGRHAERALQAELDAIGARGEPLAWRELAGPAVADADNAALLLRKIADVEFVGGQPADMDDRTYARLSKLVYSHYPTCGHRKRHREDVDKVFEIAAEAMALCRQARGRSGCDWGVDFTRPAITLTRPSTAPYRNLGRVLEPAALAAHDDGRDGEAVEIVLDLLAMGRRVGEAPSLLACLLEYLNRAQAASAVESILPELKIGPAPAATPEQVRALIAELLDDRHAQQTLVRAFILERSLKYDTFDRLLRGDPTVVGGFRLRAGPIGRLLVPMWRLDQARTLRWDSGNILAARQPTWPAAEAVVPVIDVPDGLLEFTARALSTMGTLTLGGTIKRQFIDRVKVTLAGVGLAVRLCEHEHGRRPAKLEDLVGEYRPAVPPDRMTAGPDPIRYKPEAKPAILYGVGVNGRDDGGDEDDTVFRLDARAVTKCKWREPTTRPASGFRVVLPKRLRQ